MDVAHALASDLSFGSGLLLPDTLWWQNTRSGPVFALYVEPKVWKLALQEDIEEASTAVYDSAAGADFSLHAGTSSLGIRGEEKADQRNGYCLPGAASQHL